MDDLSATPFGRARLRNHEAGEAGAMSRLTGVLGEDVGTRTDILTVASVHMGLTGEELADFFLSTLPNAMSSLMAQQVALEEALMGYAAHGMLVGYFLRDEQVKAEREAAA
jgi:hypothetical protein